MESMLEVLVALLVEENGGKPVSILAVHRMLVEDGYSLSLYDVEKFLRLMSGTRQVKLSADGLTVSVS